MPSDDDNLTRRLQKQGLTEKKGRLEKQHSSHTELCNMPSQILPQGTLVTRRCPDTSRGQTNPTVYTADRETGTAMKGCRLDFLILSTAH